MTYGDQTSEEMIKVMSDPRLNVSTKAINEVYAASKELEGMRQTAADAVKQLVESKTTAEEYSKMLAKIDKKKYKDEIKASKDIAKQIDSVMAIYLGKVDDRQGITRNPDPNVNQRLGNAGRYVGSRQNGLTATEKRLMDQAKTSLNDALDKTNSFFTEEWAPYKAKMEGLEISPFKETKTFNKH